MTEIPDILHKYMKQSVEVTHARFGLRCACGHEWGVSLDPNIDLTMQAQKLICLPCMQRELNNKNGKDKGDNNEYNNKKYDFEK